MAVPAALEAAVSFTELDRLVRFVARLCGCGTNWLRLLGLESLEWASMLDGHRASRIRFGTEFCQRLLPSPRALEKALRVATASGLDFGLALPMLSDDGLVKADALLGMLPEGTEVTVNDWGLMRRLERRFAGLRPSAGRLLCKMLKEPRAPSAAYMELGGRGFLTPGLEILLARLGVDRVEIDVPPFACSKDLCVAQGRLSVHVPFGFVTTGRICRIGNLRQPLARKFATGHACARECLTYANGLAATREPSDVRMSMFQRGNTIFYRHTAAMTAALAEAIAAGSVDRVIVSGDWHEARSSDIGA